MRFSPKNSRAAKIKPRQVLQARALYEMADSAYTQAALARMYNVSAIQMGRILRYECWRELTPEVSEEQALRESAERLLEVQQEVDVRAELGAAAAHAQQEDTPGETQADTLLSELDAEAKARVWKYLK